MQISIIIPFHNEAEYLERTLESLVDQSVPPDRLILVNDSSTDASPDIAAKYAERHPFIQLVHHTSSPAKSPGSKVIEAFNFGAAQLDHFDLIGKFDADIVLPSNYLETCIRAFENTPHLGMYSGLLYIDHKGELRYESISNKDHVRGPIKLYSKECFRAIGGLIPALGWDSVDTLLAEARGFKVATNSSLIVHHLRPTSGAYANSAYYLKRGESYYQLGYDLFISLLSAIKMAWRKQSLQVLLTLLRGYSRARKKGLRLVDDQAKQDILKIRYKRIWRTIIRTS